MRELDEAISLCVGLMHHGDIKRVPPLNLHLRIVGSAEGLTRAGRIMGVESILAGVGPSFSVLVTKRGTMKKSADWVIMAEGD